MAILWSNGKNVMIFQVEHDKFISIRKNFNSKLHKAIGMYVRVICQTQQPAIEKEVKYQAIEFYAYA